MENTAPLGGYNLEEIQAGGSKDPLINYATSKAANWMLAVEAGELWGGDGILSVCQNPGNLKTHIYDSQPKLMMFFVNFLLHPPKMGAYTELFAGLSGDITEKEQGCYIIPWGRIQSLNPRKDIYEAMKEGKGKELWDWCEAQIKIHE
ncbi:hypothetical protein LCER1_G004844 [Lachnellula cervina]|uniref:Uncharacterized protein n=1 Tax=Lachnellula cervina TaxID=1316786 RepID=A0A7D8UZJ0_9HELO|nr:hypothetical protein LCER1_G004844 [Lachnellula cervina]